MGAEIQEFVHTAGGVQDGSLRVLVDESGDPWFVASDICDALGIDKTAASRLDEDEKGLRSAQTPGGEQRVLFVSEPGFYKLVMRSRKPEAKAFQRWVTHTVLPSIRKDGAYVYGSGYDDENVLIARALKAVDRRLRESEQQREALQAENEAMAPMARMYKVCMDGERWRSVTETARLLAQCDRTMTRDRLTHLLMSDGMLTKDRQATRLAIQRGYLMNYMPPSYWDADQGERRQRKPYGKVTSKGLDWCARRYCGQAMLPVDA